MIREAHTLDQGSTPDQQAEEAQGAQWNVLKLTYDGKTVTCQEIRP